MNALDVKSLYKQLIIDHNRNPRNFGVLEDPTQRIEGFNPLCGDKLVLYLIIGDKEIKDIRFEGTGCAISIASASLMTDTIKGMDLEQAKELFQSFYDMVTEDFADENTQALDMGRLTALAGVKDYPARVKCATLCWHALKTALNGENSTVTTE